MKKNVFWAVLMLLPAVLQAQYKEPAYPVKNSRIYYEKVVQVDSATASQLYDRCKVWVGKTFVSAKSVIVSDTKDELVIAANFPIYLSNIGATTEQLCEFRLTVGFKDGRFRYILDNVQVWTTVMTIPAENFIADEKVWRDNGKPRLGLNLQYRKQIVEKINSLLTLLEADMASSQTGEW